MTIGVIRDRSKIIYNDCFSLVIGIQKSSRMNVFEIAVVHGHLSLFPAVHPRSTKGEIRTNRLTTGMANGKRQSLKGDTLGSAGESILNTNGRVMESPAPTR